VAFDEDRKVADAMDPERDYKNHWITLCILFLRLPCDVYIAEEL